MNPLLLLNISMKLGNTTPSCLWIPIRKKAIERLWAKGSNKRREVKEAKETLEVIEEEPKGKKLFGGDKIGLIDIVLGWICIWLVAIEEASLVKIFDSEKCACIAKWMVDFVEWPFVKQNLPPRDKLANYYKKVRHSVLALPASN
ncbi:hypothetical protein Pint_20918 [Pistacia integerrima]|uniref:Uncharacterized protein n=1 Tax=Pistacia integerrima TaxID=434235 RepID=A0ACC0X7S5_9ROSI|nr:hypothetical protein Pint_20918 [Pistacia integerrima]